MPGVAGTAFDLLCGTHGAMRPHSCRHGDITIPRSMTASGLSQPTPEWVDLVCGYAGVYREEHVGKEAENSTSKEDVLIQETSHRRIPAQS